MVVGLTGGIGSGKTHVAHLFFNLGIPIYIADVEAKKIMHTDTVVRHKITTLFGENAYVENVLNRAYIAKKVFKNKVLLEELNAIVHPAVAAHFSSWYAAQKTNFVIKESAILFETGNYLKCDKTILITAPKKVRIARVLKRDKTTVEEIENRMRNQWSDEKKSKLSDYIIENQDLEKTKTQVKAVFDDLSK